MQTFRRSGNFTMSYSTVYCFVAVGVASFTVVKSIYFCRFIVCGICVPLCSGLDNKCSVFPLSFEEDATSRRRAVATHTSYMSCCTFLKSDNLVSQFSCSFFLFRPCWFDLSWTVLLYFSYIIPCFSVIIMQPDWQPKAHLRCWYFISILVTSVITNNFNRNHLYSRLTDKKIFFQILTGSGDSTCAIWDVESGQRVQNFNGHTGDIFTIDVPTSNTSNVFISGVSISKHYIWPKYLFVAQLGLAMQATNTITKVVYAVVTVARKAVRWGHGLSL